MRELENLCILMALVLKMINAVFIQQLQGSLFLRGTCIRLKTVATLIILPCKKDWYTQHKHSRSVHSFWETSSIAFAFNIWVEDWSPSELFFLFLFRGVCSKAIVSLARCWWLHRHHVALFQKTSPWELCHSFRPCGYKVMAQAALCSSWDSEKFGGAGLSTATVPPASALRTRAAGFSGVQKRSGFCRTYMVGTLFSNDNKNFLPCACGEVI